MSFTFQDKFMHQEWAVGYAMQNEFMHQDWNFRQYNKTGGSDMQIFFPNIGRVVA